jgi:DivIVA domain-containing protein
MPLTPAEVHNVVFKKPPIGKRGYDEEEVDSFLDIIEVELARLIEENAELKARGGAVVASDGSGAASASADGSALAAAREENKKLAARLSELEAGQNRPAASGQGGDQAELTAARAENEKLLARISELEGSVAQAGQALSQAQQEVAAAKAAGPSTGSNGSGLNQLAQAERVLALAQQAADEQTAAAKADYEKTLAEARSFHDKTIADAQSRADQLDAESRTQAAAAVEEAERRAHQVTSQLEQRKTDLENRLEELRTFEHEYRSRLKSYLESQLRDLEVSNRAEPTEQELAAPTTS